MGHHIQLPILTAMKTTVEISDPLLAQARKLADRQGMTLRALIERGLHRIIQEQESGAVFKLRRASFAGEGLQAGFRDEPWERIRDAVYRGRGA
jgi:hypothetical protein